MRVDTVQAIVSVAGLVLALVGLPVVFVQIRELQRSVRSAAHAAIYAQAADFRSHLVDHPHLRKFFFDGAELPADHPERERVLTIAELFLNYLEHMAVTGESFGKENRAALERYCRDALARSPVLRQILAEHPEAYSHALRPYLDEIESARR